MPAAVSAKAAFDLKSTAWTLTALRLQTADVATLAAALDERFADRPGLFDQDAVTIDLSALRDADTLLDMAALLPHLRRHGMLPIAAQGGSPAQMAAARAAGLAEAPDAQSAAAARLDAAPPPALRDVMREVMPEVVNEVPVNEVPVAVVREVVREVPVLRDAPPEPAAVGLPSSVAPLVIDKPLRSGQRVYARGGDLIVLAVVSVGAEVIADGNIHVYAPLRGRAIAGARGDVNARIFCTCLEPQLVAIAGIYRTTETPLPADVLGRAAQVRLDGEKIIVEALKS